MIFLSIRSVSFCKMFFFLPFLFFSCSEGHERWRAYGRTVEVVQEGDEFHLLRHGKPYYIKGAGTYTNLEEVKEAGGNSIRIWDTNDAGRILDQAHQLGLTVNLGVWLTREKEGFDYDNKKAVEEQFEHVKRQVLKYKDHPALLMWSIANEMNKGSTNIRAWDAINDIAKMIHEQDPNHPVTTAIMDFSLRTVRIIKERCPELDILSVNTYGGLNELPEAMEESVWDGPYFVSEYGNEGYWEVLFTSWEAPLEPNSTQKANFIRDMYGQYFLEKQDRCLGSYVFFWGYKYEKTHTWFSLFSENGEKTEAVDVLSHLWKGSWPENHTPKITSLKLKENLDANDLIVDPGDKFTAEIIAHDPEGDSLAYHWEVLPEVEVEDAAVDLMEKPDAIPERIESTEEKLAQWKAPEEQGAYRLFVKVTDGRNNMATANLPFHVGPVEKEKQAAESPIFQKLLNYFSPEN